MKMEFTGDDFCDADRCRGNGKHTVYCNGPENALIANARLREMLTAAPVVYARKSPADGEWTAWGDVQSKDRISGDTHRARLVDIEKLK